MHIHGIHIKNFLSFRSFSWGEIDPHLNIIVGPNGVGKTNLFHALRAIKDALNTTSKSDTLPWSRLTHLGINTPVIEIVLEIEFTSKWEQSLLCMFVAAAMCNEQFLRDNNPGQLNPDEVLLFSNFLLEEIRPELLEWFFSGQLIISYDGLQWSSRYEGKGTMFHLHVMGLYNTSLLSGIAWNEFVQKIRAKQKEEGIYLPHLESVLQKLVEGTGGFILRIEQPHNYVLPTHQAFQQLIGSILQNNRFYEAVFVFQTLLEHAFVFTDNVRRKPLSNILESELNASNIDLSNGEQLALYLFKKKNGVPQNRAQYDAIQKTFMRLTNRHFDVGFTASRQSNIELDIHLVNQWGDIPLEFSGAGIAEALFLSSLIASGDERVILLDEPASTIHVTMQKAFMNEIRMHSENNNQFLIVTHSPTLVDPSMLTNISYFAIHEGNTYRTPVSALQMNTQERKRLEQELRKSIESRALLFSRSVILVEGETELAALPIWFEKTFKPSFEGQDITVYTVGGDQNFTPLLQFLQWFRIPWAIVCDGKVISYHLSNYPAPGSNKSIVEQLEEAGISCTNQLPKTDFSRLCQELESHGVFTLAKMETDEFEELPIIKEHTSEAKRNFPRSKVRRAQYIAETYPCPTEVETLLQKVVQYLQEQVH